MEKQVYELTIDPDLRDLIPPLSEEEYRMLEDSIVRDGCDTPLTVWNGTIVDGHNRYAFARSTTSPLPLKRGVSPTRKPPCSGCWSINWPAAT